MPAHACPAGTPCAGRALSTPDAFRTGRSFAATPASALPEREPSHSAHNQSSGISIIAERLTWNDMRTRHALCRSHRKAARAHPRPSHLPPDHREPFRWPPRHRGPLFLSPAQVAARSPRSTQAASSASISSRKPFGRVRRSSFRHALRCVHPTKMTCASVPRHGDFPRFA